MTIEARRKSRVMLMVVCATLAVVSASAQAQQRPPQQVYDIPAQDLGTALTKLARQSNREIYFPATLTRGKRAPRLSGKMSFESALRKLLNDTGLAYRVNANGSVVIIWGPPTRKIRRLQAAVEASRGQDAEGRATIADILVTGKRDWNLNLDIQRTADDAQPYVVFTHKDIQRSGATSLEDFFRTNLGANNTPTNSTQIGSSQSLTNLRGLGLTNTLILVDGRRYAQANLGAGIFTQSSINGIDLDSIDRIEVLASSASGIYGSSAVGGVINIIVRRNFRGIEATAYYGITSRGDAAEKRLSLNGSFPLEGGRTRLSFTGSWQQTGSLTEGDRDYSARGRELLLANNSSYLSSLTNPVMGATPNIRSTDGSALKLKPQYGGTALGANTTFVPVGYRGIAQDGVAALVANAGKQNLDIAPTTAGSSFGNGALATLITPTKSYNASVTVRRDFNNWLNLYGEFGYSRYEITVLRNPAANIYTLPATSADNPFTTAINIALPVSAGNVASTTTSTNKRALAGAIIKLPYTWQAAIDLTWNWNRYSGQQSLPGMDQATLTRLQTGTLSVVKDVNQFPVPFTYLDRPSGGTLGSTSAFSRSYTLKLAGPLPWLRLWGGKPILSVQLEQDKQTQGEYVGFSNTAGPSGSSIGYTPPRSQRTESAYGEVRFPIIGKDNHVPLIRELELQVAGRYDRYTGVGSDTRLQCFPSLSGPLLYPGPLPASAFDAPCPQPGGAPAVFVTTRNHSFNKTIALRWAPTQDITFRGSYSTGYTPPPLNQLVPNTSALNPTIIGPYNLGTGTIVGVTDPLRGNEPIGTLDLAGFGLRILPAIQGGNPNVDPQTSKSWSFGTILTPRFVPGLRLSADWSRITMNDVYYSPGGLLGGLSLNTPAQQKAFEDFLAAHPERFKRDTNPATFGPYGVGPIIQADISLANFSFLRTESIDFAASYDTRLGKGNLRVQGAATWLRDLTFQLQPSSAPVQAAGIVSPSFTSVLSTLGGVSWKGNGSIVYSTDRWSLGINGRYVGPYWLNYDHSVSSLQGSAKIGAQTYFDIFGSFRIFKNTELSAGVNNVFDHSPPIVAATNTFYSFFGDPRRANFYLSVNQKF
jgi:outer membrane receptor protein involved in Fe transport